MRQIRAGTLQDPGVSALCPFFQGTSTHNFRVSKQKEKLNFSASSTRIESTFYLIWTSVHFLVSGRFVALRVKLAANVRICLCLQVSLSDPVGNEHRIVYVQVSILRRETGLWEPKISSAAWRRNRRSIRLLR